MGSQDVINVDEPLPPMPPPPSSMEFPPLPPLPPPPPPPPHDDEVSNAFPYESQFVYGGQGTAAQEVIFPVRSSSVATPAPNFSRKPMVARKPPPIQHDDAHGQLPSSRSRYRARKESATLPAQDQAVHDRSRNSSTPSSDGDAVSTPSREPGTPDTGSLRDSNSSLPRLKTAPLRQVQPMQHVDNASQNCLVGPSSAAPSVMIESDADISNQSTAEMGMEQDPTLEEAVEQYSSLQYHHQVQSESHLSSATLSRPMSSLTLGSNSNLDGQKFANHKSHLSVGGTPSPSSSPVVQAQGQSPHRYSPEHRPTSYIDLLHIPYRQQVAPAPNLDNSFLRSAVGANASLLETTKTLEMYRANVKKTNDAAIQYEFAIFMLQTAMELPPGSEGPSGRAEMLREARQILQKLADRSYPFAQYYLADGYASGLFNKGKEDYDRAFPLFVAASKRGHAEAGYRAALCYEFGWGCRKDYAKAVKFYETSAAKNHPGAATRLGMACLNGTMGLSGKYKEGLKWLKRAAESADAQYNAAPYELARLHENGYGGDVFKDEAYAAQLYTQSADLGHPEANLVMGKAYEHGLLMCPKDAGLSIHFYNAAAQAEMPEAMMALCAWYLFGAEPVLERDDAEAFEWAKHAADLNYAKAEYAVGYFKEVGIGCKQDSLEANMWYWRAAQQGEERAKQRMAAIQDAVSGGSNSSSLKGVETLKTKKSFFNKLGL